MEFLKRKYCTEFDYVAFYPKFFREWVFSASSTQHSALQQRVFDGFKILVL